MVKVGDTVKRVKMLLNNYGVYYSGHESFEIKKFNKSGNCALDPNGMGHHLDNLELVKAAPTHFPLYSEEAAVKLLEERGYAVTPPPEPLKGKVVVYQGKASGTTYSAIIRDLDIIKNNGHTILAIVDWTEGQGIS